MLRLFRHYVPGAVFLVAAMDVAIVVGSILVVRSFGSWIGEGALWPKAAVLTGTVVLSLYLADLYDPRLDLGRRELLARIGMALAVAGVTAAALGFALPPLRFGRLAFGQILGLMLVGLSAWRWTWFAIGSTDRLRDRVLVLGVSSSAESIVELQTTGARRFTVVGFLADNPSAHEELPAGMELLGKTQDLLNIVDELQPDLVLVSLRDMRGAFPADDLLQCRLRGIRVEDWPSFYEKQTGRVLVTGLRPSWLIFSDGFVKTPMTQNVKRALDVLLALVGLPLAAAVMVVVAAAIKLDSRGPVLYRQERVGQGGRIFVLNKFRSMQVDAERQSGAVWAVSDDPRVTRIGRILRTTRLDELPQLINVLVGDMSFIGPRPERPEFIQMLQRKVPLYMERLSVKPGITGWAQVRLHYGASVEDALEKLQYDLYYIKNLSLFLDLVILVSTVQVVLFGRGAR